MKDSVGTILLIATIAIASGSAAIGVGTSQKKSEGSFFPTPSNQTYSETIKSEDIFFEEVEQKDVENKPVSFGTVSLGDGRPTILSNNTNLYNVRKNIDAQLKFTYNSSAQNDMFSLADGQIVVNNTDETASKNPTEQESKFEFVSVYDYNKTKIIFTQDNLEHLENGDLLRCAGLVKQDKLAEIGTGLMLTDSHAHLEICSDDSAYSIEEGQFVAEQKIKEKYGDVNITVLGAIETDEYYMYQISSRENFKQCKNNYVLIYKNEYYDPVKGMTNADIDDPYEFKKFVALYSNSNEGTCVGEFVDQNNAISKYYIQVNDNKAELVKYEYYVEDDAFVSVSTVLNSIDMYYSPFNYNT